MLKLRQVVSEQGKCFLHQILERMSRGNGVSIGEGSSSKVSHVSRSEYVAFQERLEQIFDDVMNNL